MSVLGAARQAGYPKHRVMESACLILGKECDAFEREDTAYCGSQHCFGVGSCLDALHIILRALCIGDHVLPSSVETDCCIVPFGPCPAYTTSRVTPCGSVRR